MAKVGHNRKLMLNYSQNVLLMNMVSFSIPLFWRTLRNNVQLILIFARCKVRFEKEMTKMETKTNINAQNHI